MTYDAIGEHYVFGEFLVLDELSNYSSSDINTLLGAMKEQGTEYLYFVDIDDRAGLLFNVYCEGQSAVREHVLYRLEQTAAGYGFEPVT